MSIPQNLWPDKILRFSVGKSCDTNHFMKVFFIKISIC